MPLPHSTRALSTLALAVTIGIGCKDSSSTDDTKDSKQQESKSAVTVFSDYKRKSMASEAKVHVGSIAIAVQSAFENGAVALDSVAPKLPDSAPMTPEPGSCCKEPEGVCGIGKGDWRHPAWMALGFQPSTPHRYSYEYVADDKGFVVRAVGDLDCDGELSKYELRGELTEDGQLNIEHEPTAENPLE